MTVTLFISLFTLGAAISGIFTEAIKKVYENDGKQYSANIVALVNSIIVGGLGTTCSYMLLNIPWTINNVICLVLMIVVIWMGSMLGYDKILQLLNQLKTVKPVKKEEKEDGNNDNGSTEE